MPFRFVKLITYLGKQASKRHPKQMFLCNSLDHGYKVSDL